MKHELLKALNDALLKAFESFGSDIDEVRELSQHQTMDGWKKSRMVKAGSLAAPAVVGGPVGLALLIPELILLMRFLRNSALGVGYIQRGAAAVEDFPAIMLWASEQPADRKALIGSASASAKVMAAKLGAVTVGPAASAKLLASAVTTQIAAMSHTTINTLAAKKGSAWLAKILLGPTLGRFVPFIGAAVGAGANAFITHKMVEAAAAYYQFLDEVAREADLG
ncbi:hypothetical protein [Brevundimonas sp. A19_0]|uniref:hypothetical protein n=1 Tax=Brevundimonas sp. A19_0 TaxID=2821087 RepID=UPI001ADBAD3E|nr:hypothetical protein [Brevundimonas sp. A19_0]MBO9502475.1 hypothetical protein [Brevundimonas sp. A19_0]